MAGVSVSYACNVKFVICEIIKKIFSTIIVLEIKLYKKKNDFQRVYIHIYPNIFIWISRVPVGVGTEDLVLNITILTYQHLFHIYMHVNFEDF